MHCPHCQSTKSTQIKRRTQLGYKQYRCGSCGKQYNERTGTTLNFIEYPTEIVMLTVHYYYRFKVSLDDVVELMLMRGIHLSHQTVHNWVRTFGIELGLKLRQERIGKAVGKWHVDSTYLKIERRWCYLYRAIDSEAETRRLAAETTRGKFENHGGFQWNPCIYVVLVTFCRAS